MNTSCSLCGRPFKKTVVWFTQPTEQSGRKFTVVFKIEATLPRDSRLCLKCSGLVIVSASAALQSHLNTLDLDGAAPNKEEPNGG